MSLRNIWSQSPYLLVSSSEFWMSPEGFKIYLFGDDLFRLTDILYKYRDFKVNCITIEKKPGNNSELKVFGNKKLLERKNVKTSGIVNTFSFYEKC